MKKKRIKVGKNKAIKTKSIKTRLIIVPLVVVLIGVSSIASVSAYFTRAGLLEEMQAMGYSASEQFIEMVEYNSQSLNIINSMLDEKIKTAGRTIKLNRDNIDSEFFKAFAKESEIDEINYFSRDGEILHSTVDEYIGAKPGEDHAVHEFKATNEEDFMEEIRQDTESDKYFKYGYIKDGMEGFIQIGISADVVQDLTETFALQSLVDEIGSKDEIGYGLLIDPNYEVIASSIEEALGVTYDAEIVKNVLTEGVPYTQESYYELENITVYDVNFPVVVDGEMLGVLSIGYSMEQIKESIRYNVIVILITGLIVFALLAFILYNGSNYAIKIVNQLKDQMGLLAEGDFTHDLSEELTSKKDEFGQISQAVSIMQDSIKNTLREVASSSEQVAASSEQLTATSEQSATAADEVAKVIEDIASGATDQAKETEHGVLAISILGDLVVENQTHIENLNATTEKVNSLKDEGLELLNELVEKTTISSEASKQVQEVINNTNESADQIANASEMIQSIADQTNLLALNAAIEAARAGEAGRGFAVVADEIRQLAEQSNQFTGEITNIINDLISKTSMGVKTMEEVAGVVSSQTESVAMTNNKFDGIAEALEEMKGYIDQVSASGEEMANRKEEIISTMEQLSAISEENAAGTQEAAASVEEQTASTQEIAHSSEELAKIAEELNGRVRQFRI